MIFPGEILLKKNMGLQTNSSKFLHVLIKTGMAGTKQTYFSYYPGFPGASRQNLCYPILTFPPNLVPVSQHHLPWQVNKKEELLRRIQ
jgi:hypothetical protein